MRGSRKAGNLQVAERRELVEQRSRFDDLTNICEKKVNKLIIYSFAGLSFPIVFREKKFFNACYWMRKSFIAFCTLHHSLPAMNDRESWSLWEVDLQVWGEDRFQFIWINPEFRFNISVQSHHHLTVLNGRHALLERFLCGFCNYLKILLLIIRDDGIPSRSAISCVIQTLRVMLSQWGEDEENKIFACFEDWEK